MWYGLPVEFRRLYSTICPTCGAKLEQREGRLMACPSCGFKANRDEVPIQWAKHNYHDNDNVQSFGKAF